MCVLLNSHPLSLNFPAAALSCFPIGETGEEKVPQVTGPFLPGLSGLFFPPSFLQDSAQPRSQVAELHLVPWEIVLFTAPWLDEDPTPGQANTVPILSVLTVHSPPLLVGIWRTKEPVSK